jgi:hypothetical protein
MYRWVKEISNQRSEWIYFTTIPFLHPVNTSCGMIAKAKNYFAYDGKEPRNITFKDKKCLCMMRNMITLIFQPPHGIMGWHEGDSAVYIYDRYDAGK